MATKADLFSEIVRREVEDAVNAIIASEIGDAGNSAMVLKRLRSYIVNGVEYRLTRRYTMLEISDTFEWNARKVGKQQ